ncbi:ABC transporter permease [Rugosibacter aromaticivorans]|uniref:ABC transporter permease n=1 Tax=Rugosibacter aromaticivorans TaxID=1565605 RepID=A0A0C5J8X1_9PROT|nr:iron ABC transporter permease [Rugosibacter aromaticivorans]AJP48425.1 ABC transporter permease [Rugosibacter aromaticivorans]TBR14807.1 MAG: iron ABC transporter permease [Rugosibacter sp.]
MPSRRRALTVLALLLALVGVSFVVALAAGSIPVTTHDLLAALFGGTFDGNFNSAGETSLAVEVIRGLRLPRALGAFACGGLLALAGALMQVLLRNPLADPYVLGISGGAAVGALLAMLAGLALWFVDLAAFAGAFAAMLIVFGLAHGDSSWTRTRLLLTGVIVAAGCGAAVALMLSIAPEAQLRGMLFWLMGDAGQISEPRPALVVLATGLALALPFARELNLLARGDVLAQTLGVSVNHVKRGVYFLAALTTATAVTTAGSIGFIGLIVPHLTRLGLMKLGWGNDQRLLLPAAALVGGSLLLLADTLARTVVAPQQLPVGVLTALIGVPVFLFLLGHDKHA